MKTSPAGAVWCPHRQRLQESQSGEGWAGPGAPGSELGARNPPWGAVKMVGLHSTIPSDFTCNALIQIGND